MEITKKFIHLKYKYKEIKNNFMSLIIKLNTIKSYINILRNIKCYANSNDIIPFEYTEKYKICSKCSRIIQNNYCENNCYSRILIKETRYNHISFKNLIRNQYYYSECYNIYTSNYKNIFINIAELYQQLNEYYELQLIENNRLQNDLLIIVNEYKEKEKNEILHIINFHDNLYKKFTKLNIKTNYKDYVNSLSFENTFFFFRQNFKV